MCHDPPRTTAAYLSGGLTRRARARFERHLLECEQCWREANTARAGRILAESAREAAPAHLRERIRAVVDLSPAPGETGRVAGQHRSRRSRRWPYLLAGTSAAVLLAVFVLLAPWGGQSTQDQPAPLTAAAQLYHATDTPSAVPEPAPPQRQIAGYDWQTSAEVQLASIPVIAYVYTNPAGSRLLIISSRTPFPRATEARTVAPAPSWVTVIDGAALLCADQDDTSWLAVAATTQDVLAAGRSLGITTE